MCEPRVIPEDKYSLAIIATLHPKLRTSARAVYDEVRAGGIKMRYTSGFRSMAEQTKIYNQGRTTPGEVVTKAAPGTSWHNYGMALDFVLLSEDGTKLIWNVNYDGPDADTTSDWTKIVQIFKRHSWAWGGDFKTILDRPHVQYTFNLTIKQALAMYQAGSVKDGYLNV
jgi:peptidoglycan L-alanyl-D-glutamate endopeptidase CwlK